MKSAKGGVNLADIKNFYDAYDFDNFIRPGDEIRFGRQLVLSPNNTDLSPFADCKIADLQRMREISEAAETKVFEELRASLSKWEEKGRITMLLDAAIQYLSTPEVEHTSNLWESNGHDRYKISNRVYEMTYDIWEDTKYDHNAQKSVPVAWYVSWEVSTRNPSNLYYSCKIAGQSNKRYTDKAAAERYLQGRIKAYSHLFNEISPPIPAKYAHIFKINGLLLPGYTVEKQPPQRSEKTAAEILESLGGGFLLPENGKASILKKLSVTRSQEKAQVKTEDVNKQKKGGFQR